MSFSLLVLGGARAGKSRYAQTRAEAFDAELMFVATAQPSDTEMADRIAAHRADRGSRWSTIGVPLELATAIRDTSRPDRLLLVDCLTLWTSNLMLAEHDIARATEELASAIGAASGPLVFVANEVGLGIVPRNVLARRFRDEAGRINQRIAAAADEVVFVAAGLPLKLK